MADTERVTLVADDLSGRTLADVVRRMRVGASWNEARELCKRGKVKRNGVIATDAAQRVALGDAIELNENAPRLRANVLDETLLVYLDHDLVVVNKPVGLLSVPFRAPQSGRGSAEETEKNTLIDRVRLLLRRKSGERDTELGAVQRLDKDTSGLIVFTRNLNSKRKMQELFRVHDIQRRYLAIAHGQVTAGSVESWLLPDRGDGLRGSHGLFRRADGAPPKDAQRALTHLRPLRALAGATLVECELETGRQHQIRIHLSERGHPIVGEAVYVRDYRGPVIAAARPMLHAQTLGFVHPRSGERLHFEQAPPADFDALLATL